MAFFFLLLVANEAESVVVVVVVVVADETKQGRWIVGWWKARAQGRRNGDSLVSQDLGMVDFVTISLGRRPRSSARAPSSLLERRGCIILRLGSLSLAQRQTHRSEPPFAKRGGGDRAPYKSARLSAINPPPSPLSSQSLGCDSYGADRPTTRPLLSALSFGPVGAGEARKSGKRESRCLLV